MHCVGIGEHPYTADWSHILITLEDNDEISDAVGEEYIRAHKDVFKLSNYKIYFGEDYALSVGGKVVHRKMFTVINDPS